jgi:16S rRNA (uracil1498-N3)-methyltransferase
MPKIFISNPSIKEDRISITGDKARYLSTVLRCKKGSELIVFDGVGNGLKTNILKADRKEIIAEVLENFAYNIESPLNLILVQGLPKGQKMDLIVQKTTELGVKEIMPLITERSQARETRKVERWQKIAEEASRQSGRSVVPVIHKPREFEQFLSGVQLEGKGDRETRRHGELKGFIFWEEGGMPLKEASLRVSSSSFYRFPDSPVYFLIGPEGGFAKEEVFFAEEKGFIVTSLGKRILKAETAAISAITLIQFLLGDMG